LLFAGSDAGGDRAAAFYSLVGTAKLNGHDPEAFLREVLARIGEHPILEIAELLPWNLQTSTTWFTENSAAPALKRARNRSLKSLRPRAAHCEEEI
jgi:transposase